MSETYPVDPGAFVNPAALPVASSPAAAPAAATSTAQTQQDAYLQYLRDQQAAQQNSLIAQLRTFAADNGLGPLLSGLEKYVRAGYTGDAVYLMTKNDPEYQAAYAARFAANAQRVKQGLPELSPATYIQMEQGYRSAMLNRGLPAGLFDNPDDFTTLIANDVSVQEVADRVDLALAVVNFDGNAQVKQDLADLYGITDVGQMAAYVLDPQRTQSFLTSQYNQNVRRASAQAAADTSGVGLSQGLRDLVAGVLTSNGSGAYQQASAGFQQVAQQQDRYQRLAALSGTSGTADELVSEQFGLTGAADVTNKKKLLASQERARFAGSSGVNATSLASGRRAQ